MEEAAGKARASAEIFYAALTGEET